MNFRTEISIEKSPFHISHEDKILSLGSCFASNIGRRLAQNKFQISSNPFGILYNPISIANALEAAWENDRSVFGELIEQEGRFHSFHLHSEMSKGSVAETESAINNTLQKTHAFLKNTSRLILTFGTAKVFRHKASCQIVANCHKLPETEFGAEILSVDQIVGRWKGLIKNFNKQKIILTVSPVRHVKDGLQNNTLSKSILRVACTELANQFENVIYFPAYEIMLDDLRDYRFYEDDFLHPTTFAQNYIWEKFRSVFLAGETKELLVKWAKILAELNHVPFHPEGEKHQNFLRKLLLKLEALNGSFQVGKELEKVKSLIRQ